MNDGKIYGKMAAIIAELGSISKDKQNAQQGFKYRGIDQFYNALHPLFAKHGVFSMPEVVNRIDQPYQTKSGATWARVVLTVKYTFYAEDGSSVCAIVDGEGVDAGDKATSKALSIANKYAFMQAFCVSTEDTIDPDADTPPERGNVVPIKQKPATPAPKTDDIAKRVEDARAYFLKNAPEKWAKICADCNLEKPDMHALAMSDDLLQKVLAAATANAQNGGKE